MLPALRSAVAAVCVAATVLAAGTGAIVLPVTLLSAAPAGAAVAAPRAAHPRADAAGPAARKGPSGVVAHAGELVDVSTGAWLWGRSTNSRQPIASITKVMTALVVVSAGDLNRKIKVTPAAVQYALANSAGTAGLVAGDVLTARQLLQGMLLPSGADAAYLLANSYGPGWRAFVRKMNAKARSLHMTETHFANFDGLPWPTPFDTYSSPRDLIILGETAMKVPLIKKIVGERSHWIDRTSQNHRYHWKNTNLLLGSFPGAIGIKTGYTTAAGYCLLFAAVRAGRQLMGVVLDSTDSDTTIRFAAARLLLTWGFAVTKPAPKPKPKPSPSPSASSPQPSPSLPIP